MSAQTPESHRAPIPNVNKPAPKTTAQEVDERLIALVDEVGRLGDVSAFVLARLNRQIDEVSKTDVALADTFRIGVATFMGDEETVDKRIRNLEKNGYPEIARTQRFCYAGNRLQASQVFEMATASIVNPIQRPLSDVLMTLSSVAAFRVGVALLQTAEQDQRVTQMSTLIPLMKEGARVLDALNIDNETIAAAIDEVGNIFWERRLIFMSLRPDIWISPEDSLEPGMLIQYRLPLTPDAAADLGWDLSSRLAEKDLVRPGFALSFLGMSDSNSMAA